MNRKSIIGTLAGSALMLGGLGVLGATPASADSTVNRSCPPSFFLSPPAPGDEIYDHNGDGLICVHPVGGTGGNSFVPGFTIKDNNQPGTNI